MATSSWDVVLQLLVVRQADMMMAEKIWTNSDNAVFDVLTELSAKIVELRDAAVVELPPDPNDPAEQEISEFVDTFKLMVKEVQQKAPSIEFQIVVRDDDEMFDDLLSIEVDCADDVTESYEE